MKAYIYFAIYVLNLVALLGCHGQDISITLDEGHNGWITKVLDDGDYYVRSKYPGFLSSYSKYDFEKKDVFYIDSTIYNEVFAQIETLYGEAVLKAMESDEKKNNLQDYVSFEFFEKKSKDTFVLGWYLKVKELYYAEEEFQIFYVVSLLDRKLNAMTHQVVVPPGHRLLYNEHSLKDYDHFNWTAGCKLDGDNAYFLRDHPVSEDVPIYVHYKYTPEVGYEFDHYSDHLKFDKKVAPQLYDDCNSVNGLYQLWIGFVSGGRKPIFLDRFLNVRDYFSLDVMMTLRLKENSDNHYAKSAHIDLKKEKFYTIFKFFEEEYKDQFICYSHSFDGQVKFRKMVKFEEMDENIQVSLDEKGFSFFYRRDGKFYWKRVPHED